MRRGVKLERLDRAASLVIVAFVIVALVVLLWWGVTPH